MKKPSQPVLDGTESGEEVNKIWAKYSEELSTYQEALVDEKISASDKKRANSETETKAQEEKRKIQEFAKKHPEVHEYIEHMDRLYPQYDLEEALKIAKKIAPPKEKKEDDDETPPKKDDEKKKEESPRRSSARSSDVGDGLKPITETVKDAAKSALKDILKKRNQSSLDDESDKNVV